MTELLLRHLDACVGASVLLVNCPDPELCAIVTAHRARDRLVALHFDYALHRRACRTFDGAGTRSHETRFEAWYAAPAEPHDLAVVFLPKSRALIEMTLAMVAGAVRPGARVVLVGENAAGIRSSRAALASTVGEVTGADSARRCTLYHATRGDTPPPRRTLDDWAERYQADVRGRSLTVVSLPGVFSHGRLDDGTRLLLETLEVRPNETLLDVGCGAGVIGLVAKHLAPEATVHMVDTSAFALEAARRTLARGAVSDAVIRPSDVFSAVDGSYSLIVSNPPFHTGVKTDHRAAEEFLRTAARHLDPGGAVVVVANHFLPYRALLERHVGPCRVLADDGRFRVYRAAPG